jgi:hypothetical protein
MKQLLAMKCLVVVTLIAVLCMFSISYAAEYNCLCTKCNYAWSSSSKPAKCPNCGNAAITFSEKTSEHTTDTENDSVAVENQTTGTAASEKGVSTAPVSCINANVVKPIVVAARENPCPGKVYCNNPNTTCGEYCCEWGYFYSNPCDCRCYRSSYDAGANCNSYFRCN